MKKNKYRNTKTEFKGIKFDSKFEANRYAELLLLEKAGVMVGLEIQKEFVLLDKFERKEKKYRKISYYADFYYFDNERREFVAEDTKGFETPVFKIKKKIFLKRYPKIAFLVNNKKKQEYL